MVDNDEAVRKLKVIVSHFNKCVSHKTENPQSRVARRSLTILSPQDFNPDGELFLRLENYLVLIHQMLCKLHNLDREVQDELHEYIDPLNSILKKVDHESSSCGLTKTMKRDVIAITHAISGLMGKLSILPDNSAIQEAVYSHDDGGDNNGKRIEDLPGLQEIAEGLTKFEAYREVEQKFMELETEQKMCLLSFAVFPENREVHRTMVMYWWIGEGILRVEGAEETVREILKEFTENKLVEPVKERRKVAPSSYKMNPFVHSSVIHISKEIGLYDIYRKGEKPMMKESEMGRVCLMEGSSNQPEAIRYKMDPRDIETVFNVSERYPEFIFKWFSEKPVKRKLIKLSKPLFKSLHVFYLGRWERTKKRPIQVRNLELMKCLKRMKNLRFLSFQGISAIRKLNSSVRKLHKLIVLDLRECSDLTKLPEKIDSLQSLVYLDMTGCHMLEYIPMRLALLNNLEVLKGFVVSDTIYDGVACKLNYLKKLKKLRKLSIEINRDDLGVHQLMEDLVKLEALMSLKVTWRRDIIHAGKPDDSLQCLPEQLEKLGLRQFPHENLPTWLQPQYLLHLKKLHIGGGRFLKGFGPLPAAKATQCGVEVLRLTCLPKLRVRWVELKQLYFPNLTIFESYECPRVSLTPCDGNGIWRSDQDD